MKQLSLAKAGFDIASKRTRKRVFLDEMNHVVPWAQLVALIQPFAPEGTTAKGGRPAFAIQTMLRIHFLQQWFGLSDPAMEEALHDVAMYCEFAQLDSGATRLPDESTILRFRHLLEAHDLSAQMLATINALLAARGMILKAGTIVDATLIAAPSSTKNSTGKRDPEMCQTQKGKQWYFGMKAHIGVDVQSGLVHTVIGTAANVHDVTQAQGLLHGQERHAFGDAGYQGVAQREESDTTANWITAMRPGKRRALDKGGVLGAMIDARERITAQIRAKVEHPFRVIKCQFGFAKVRYKGLAKNTAQLVTLFALSNVWMARRRLMETAG